MQRYSWLLRFSMTVATADASDVSFEADQVVDFNGQKHQIKTVETLYDNLKLHHYEIGMVRYGKD